MPYVACASVFKAEEATVVIVEDDAGVRDALEALMRSVDYRCRSYPSAEAFLEQTLPDPPCCLLLDLDLPGIDGLALQSVLAERGLFIPTVFLSGNTNPAHVTSAMNAGALSFYHKPADPEQLLTCTERGLKLSMSAV